MFSYIWIFLCNVWFCINSITNVVLKYIVSYIFILAVIKVILYLLIIIYEIVCKLIDNCLSKINANRQKVSTNEFKNIKYSWQECLKLRILSEFRKVDWSIRCFLPHIRTYNYFNSKLDYIDYWMPSQILGRITRYLIGAIYPSWYHFFVFLFILNYNLNLNLNKQKIEALISIVSIDNIEFLSSIIKNITVIITGIVIVYGVKSKMTLYGEMKKKELEYILEVQKKRKALVRDLLYALEINIKRLIENKQRILNCYLNSVLTNNEYFVGLKTVEKVKGYGLKQVSYVDQIENCFHEFISLEDIKIKQNDIRKICEEQGLDYSKNYYKENRNLLIWYKLELKSSEYLGENCLGKEEMVIWLKNITNNSAFKDEKIKDYVIDKMVYDEVEKVADIIDDKIQDAMDIKVILEKYDSIATRREVLQGILGRFG